MDLVANSGNDEFYTPEYAVLPILKYIQPESNVWCPFDTKDSLFVKKFREGGHNVIATHIESGQDFFKLAPYSVKGDVLQRLFDINIPFAMLVGVVGLFESRKRFDMFRNNEFEIMYFNKRVKYFKSYNDPKPSLNPPFSSVYICHNILPKQIVFEEI